MNRSLRFLPWIFLAIAAWVGLKACNTMQGKMAPSLVSTEMVGGSATANATALAPDSWKLLAFFGPT
ncbi:MAG: hypothetical protein QF489_03710 [Planctomycetota bacterium]|nr:hypothetical protein [Planctomycetota bacterium]